MVDSVLVVDDDRNVRYSLRRMFKESAFEVREARNGKEAIESVQKEPPDLVLMDIKMPGMSGLEILAEMKRFDPRLLVVIMTAYGTTENAIDAMKMGAFDYVLKPFDVSYLRQLVAKALQVNRLMKTVVTCEPEECRSDAECIIGSSPKMQEVYKLIGQVAEKDILVLLRGESGTGKELVARAIYHHSKRSGMTFLPVNCAAIPETLLESELFGHEKGAFTGAQIRRIGKFEQANRGTIFLDEIGDMSLTTQAKVLRVLQEKEITRLGSNEPIRVDVRLIVATNRDLEREIREGKFREDLYYRLNAVTIRLPRLAERKEDIPALAAHFLKKYSRELRKSIVDITEEALMKLTEHDWPGNVRELDNVVKMACVLCKGTHILTDELPFAGAVEPVESAEERPDEVTGTTEDLFNRLYTMISSTAEGKAREGILSVMEKELIIRALRATGGNQVQAAKILGMNRNTLRSRIEKYAIKLSKDVAI